MLLFCKCGSRWARTSLSLFRSLPDRGADEGDELFGVDKATPLSAMVMSKSPYVRFHPTSACTGPTWIVKRNVIGKYMHRDNLIREDGKRKLESDRPPVPRGYTRATPLSRAAASLFIMIYTFYIFNRKGDCVYYEEWNRKRPPANLAQEQKLMFGLLYVFSSSSSSVKNLSIFACPLSSLVLTLCIAALITAGTLWKAFARKFLQNRTSALTVWPLKYIKFSSLHNWR